MLNVTDPFHDVPMKVNIAQSFVYFSLDIISKLRCTFLASIPQNIRQSLRSLPDESCLPPPESQSSMMKKNVVPEKKQAVKKYSCPDCPKTYTQSHNLKDHQRKKHNL